MTATLPVEALTFLSDLESHNEREWFLANKKRYESVLKNPVRDVIVAVNEALDDISPRHVTPPNKAVNRINRDVRFSKDKTPYNTNVWAGWMPQDAPKGAGAGFFFGFSRTGGGVGCGVWAPDKERLAAMRAHFAGHHDHWVALTRALGPDYVVGAKDALKRVPKPWPADHPAAELLKSKGVHLKAELDPTLLTAPDLVGEIAARFRAMAPVVAYLNHGLGV